MQRKPREGETAEQIAAEQQGQRDEGGFFDIEVELVEEEEAMPDLVGEDGNAAPAVPLDEAELERAREGQVRRALREQIDREIRAENPDPLEQNNGDLHPQDLDNIVRGAQHDVDALGEELQQAAQPGRNGRARRNNNGWEIRQNVSTANVASTIMGALFFPAISSIMGDLLKVALPAKWVTKESSRWGVKVSGGILKEKWGRSIIGGCLFVVLKDAVTLYCKWKKARDFGKKRILDYVGERRQAGTQG